MCTSKEDTHLFDFIDASLLLGDGLLGISLFHLVHTSTGSLFHHGQNLFWLHVQDLRDPPLHDEEMRVVHIELDRVEQVLNAALLSSDSVDHVLVASTDNHL